MIGSLYFVCQIMGFFFVSVPSANKKDQRSIEETLADIKRKKMKVAHTPECSTSG